jgi:hypothetical protein
VRAKSQDKDIEAEAVYNLPLEEMKYIEWESDSFEGTNEEGFLLVSNNKKKKSPNINARRSLQKPRVTYPILLMNVRSMKKMYLGRVPETI